MKRIKTFAIFESAEIEDSLLHDLEDLSLEIRDKGFLVEVQRVDFYDPAEAGRHKPAISLDIWYDSDERDPFYLSEIEEEVGRIMAWSEESGLKAGIAMEFGDNNPEYVTSEEFLAEYGGSDFVCLSIILFH
jgi:hypothetical protein